MHRAKDNFDRGQSSENYLKVRVQQIFSRRFAFHHIVASSLCDESLELASTLHQPSTPPVPSSKFSKFCVDGNSITLKICQIQNCKYQSSSHKST